MLPWPRASEIEAMKSASSCRFAGGRAASGMIGLVGSLRWSAIYQTVPAYLGFVYASLSNSTSSGRGVFGSSIFACGVIHGDAAHERTMRESHVCQCGLYLAEVLNPRLQMGGRLPC